MLDPVYAARQIDGVWRMIWARPDWPSRLQRTLDDVFRSPAALLVSAPFALIGYAFLRRAASSSTELGAPLAHLPFTPAIVFQLAGYLIDWALSIALLLALCRWTGAARRAGDVVIAQTWAQTFVAPAQAAPLILLGMGLHIDAAMALLLPALAFAIACQWGVLRRAMDASVGVAILAIIGLGGVGLVVSAVINAVAGVFYASGG